MVLTPDRNIMEQQAETNDNRCVENNSDEVAEPLRVTNFSIEEILKPNFGSKILSVNIDNTFSAFTPVRHKERQLPGHLAFRPQSCSPSPSCSSGTSSPSTSSPSPSTTPTTPGSERQPLLWPAWVYCTRYSDRPSSGPRSRKMKGNSKKEEKVQDDKRPRTAFTNEQLQRLKREFESSRYLTEKQRHELADDLDLTEAQIKIWFQNKRAKIKKTSGMKNSLALSLMSQGLYNHSTVTVKEEASMDLSL